MLGIAWNKRIPLIGTCRYLLSLYWGDTECRGPIPGRSCFFWMFSGNSLSLPLQCIPVTTEHSNDAEGEPHQRHSPWELSSTFLWRPGSHWLWPARRPMLAECLDMANEATAPARLWSSQPWTRDREEWKSPARFAQWTLGGGVGTLAAGGGVKCTRQPTVGVYLLVSLLLLLLMLIILYKRFRIGTANN